MSTLSIRPARPEELDRVHAAYFEWGYGGGAELDDDVLLAERDGNLLGLVRCTRENGITVLRGMQVAPPARRQGIGTRLLNEFVRRFGDLECYCVPYRHLIAFYGSEGFAVVHPREQPPSFLAERVAKYKAAGLDVILMHRASEAQPRV